MWTSVEDVLFRIDRNAVEKHLVVNMRTGASAGVAHFGDDLTASDRIAALFQRLVNMTEPGDETVSVIDDQHDAQQPLAGSVGDHAVGSGANQRPLAVGDIKAL